MPSPFATVALALWERGYSIVPLEPGDKAIKLPGWQRYCKERANRDTLEMWLDWPERNIGLALGPASGVIALDFDYDRDGKHAEIIKIIGDSPVKKRGAKGHTGFYRFSNQRSVKYSIGGDSVLEVLSTGRQTVLPPSIHPDTKQPYEWLTKRTLLDTSPEELPEITAEAMTAVDRLFRSEERQASVMNPVKSFREMGTDDVTEALRHIPADDYHLWIKTGMALKDELGERGYLLWDAWSATSTKYAGPAETSKKWQSFKGSGVHIETLSITRGKWDTSPSPCRSASGAIS